MKRAIGKERWSGNGPMVIGIPNGKHGLLCLMNVVNKSLWSVSRIFLNVKEAARLIKNLAYYDELTGLPNRRFLLNN